MKEKLEERFRELTKTLATKLIISAAALIFEGFIIGLYFEDKVSEFYNRMKARRREYRKI